MEKVDIVIIGAGVVGLAIASELDGRNSSIIVLERHETFGKETSSRNSGVIHSGIYYPPNSLKANLCVEGNRLLYEICERHNIPYKKIGKLIVATNENELKKLEVLLKNGQNNGINDLRLVDKEELRVMEPNVSAISAIYSPSTGIVDVYSLMRHFYLVARGRGVEFIYNSEVCGIRKLPCGNGDFPYQITIKEKGGGYFSFNSRIVINSAGLEADKIAQLVGIDIKKNEYELCYCKGEYFSVNPSKWGLIKHLIYPLPGGESLGIHSVLDLDGRLKIGPNAYYIERNSADYTVKEENKTMFYQAVNTFLPFIQLADLSPDTAGIRPKFKKEKDTFCDFVIADESENGFPSFINLIGIESPGLTCAPAIARYIKNILLNKLGLL